MPGTAPVYWQYAGTIASDPVNGDHSYASAVSPAKWGGPVANDAYREITCHSDGDKSWRQR